jgi:hypothetical protein
MMPVKFGCLTALLLWAALDQTGAQSFGSTYTSTAPKHCRQIGKPSEVKIMGTSGRAIELATR